MLIFIHNAFRTSTPMNFIFCSIYKVFCRSVSVISKLVYSVILCPCIIIIRIHSKKSKQIGEIGMVGQSVLLTEMPTPGDLKPGDSLIFTNPTHPPPNQLTQPPMGMQRSYKKLQPLFKNFSRTTLDFQGHLTRNIISQTVQKCTFPVHSNKTLRL